MQGQRNNGYIFMYSGIFAVFILYLLALFLLTGNTFKQSKTEDVKESMKLVIKGLSFMMCLFLYFLQIPMQTLLLQGYQCDEDNSEILVLSSITCDSLEHKILIVTSTVLLIIFVIFLLLESYFYTSNNFEEVVPWASFDKQLTSIRIIIKLIISSGFVFDKAGNFRWEVNLICFFIQLFIVVRRYQSAIIFNTSVLYAQVFYESLSMWLYAAVSVHIFSGTHITVCTLAAIVFIGLCTGLVMVYLQIIKKESFLTTSDTFQAFDSALDYMIYLQRLYT